MDGKMRAYREAVFSQQVEQEDYVDLDEDEYPYPVCREHPRCPYLSDEGDDDIRCLFNEEFGFLKVHKVIAVDFDDTLFENHRFEGQHNYGKAKPRAKDFLEWLKGMGLLIMIYSCRCKTETIRKALEEHDMPFDFINENPLAPPCNDDSKPYAMAYIGDNMIQYEGNSFDIVKNKIMDLERKMRKKARENKG